MKLIIDIDKDYYELIKADVKSGNDYKPCVLIANGKPCDKTLTNHDIDSAYDKGFITAMKAYARPKGEWVIVDDCEQFIAKCSVCGRIEDSRLVKDYPFCHCGAKMMIDCIDNAPKVEIATKLQPNCNNLQQGEYEQAVQTIWDRCQHCEETEQAFKVLRGATNDSK